MGSHQKGGDTAKTSEKANKKINRKGEAVKMLKLFVGNLSFNTTEDELKELFAQAGTVQSVTIIKDKYTNNSKGFAFIEMSSNDEAEKAIAQLNGKDLNGRNLSVAEARPPREHRPGGGGSRGGGYGGGGYGRGGGGGGGRRRY